MLKKFEKIAQMSSRFQKFPPVLILVATGLGLAVQLDAQPSQAAENALFGSTHMQASPLSLSQGTLVYGTTVAYGVADFLQVSTDVIRDAYSVWNVGIKLSIFDQPEFAAAVTAGWETFNFHDIDPHNPNIRINAWTPGVIFAHELIPNVAMFYGANLYLANADKPLGALNSGYTQGARLGSDVSWAYGSGGGKKNGGIGNVVSAGVTWDVTYQTIGFGISHHWPGFKLGIHYYPTADQYKVLPMISGGGSLSI